MSGFNKIESAVIVGKRRSQPARHRSCLSPISCRTSASNGEPHRAYNPAIVGGSFANRAGVRKDLDICIHHFKLCSNHFAHLANQTPRVAVASGSLLTISSIAALIYPDRHHTALDRRSGPGSFGNDGSNVIKHLTIVHFHNQSLALSASSSSTSTG